MKRGIFILCFVQLLFGCKSESFDIENINGNKIDVLGHAGMGVSNLYPSNSAESILNCLNLGATGSEMDVQMTSDGVLVLFHDESLDQKTNQSGVIHSQTWDQIKTAEYDEVPYTHYNIVKLRDIIENIENLESFIFTLDIKLYSESTNMTNYIDQFTDALVSLFSEYNLYNYVYVESQSTDFLNVLQSKASNIDLYYYPQTFQDGLNKALNFNLKGISISSSNITKEQIADAHNAGVFITVWGTQSEEENIEAIRKNPDMIQTDRVKYLVDILTEQNLIH